jgi:muconolactone D-isomerase
VDFLVDITVRLPPALAAEERLELMRAERVRGRELIEAGAIQHIWRIPGALRNVSVWRAQDATELHELITSIPAYPYCEVHVTALATHPLQGGPEGGPAPASG